MKKRIKFFTKIKNEFINYHPCKLLSLLFLFVPIFVGLSSAIFLDNDFWFLINTGKYIVEHGFPAVEPFTIHANFSFIVQQWLTDVIFYYVHLWFGGWGIVVLTMLLFILILYLSYRLCLLVSENRVNQSILLTGIMGFLLSLIFIRSRPQLFDFVILLLLLYLLELYIKKKNNRYLYPLPFLSLLLINLHASSFIMMFMFMIPYIIGSFKFKFLCFESEGYSKKPLFITVVFMFLFGFLNPYGFSAITYLFTSYGNFYINNLVNEMKSPVITSTVGMTIYGTIFLVLMCYIVSKKRTIKIRYFLLFLGTAFLGLTSIKGFSFFIIAGIFSLGYQLKDSFLVYEDNYIYSRGFKIKYAFLLVFIFLGLGLYVYHNHKDFYEHRISSIVDYLYDLEKIDPENTSIYTSYDDGSFAEYRGLRVYIDPRAEVFVKKNNHQKDVMKEYCQLQHGEVSIDEFLEQYKFDYLIVNTVDYMYRHYLNTEKNDLYENIYGSSFGLHQLYLYKRIDK